jgi:hypothetical protein
MTNQTASRSVRLPAEERSHPAAQKQARACIAPARLCHKDVSDVSPPDEPEESHLAAQPTQAGEGICHE